MDEKTLDALMSFLDKYEIPYDVSCLYNCSEEQIGYEISISNTELIFDLEEHFERVSFAQ